MKKVILIMVVFTTCMVMEAQTNTQNPPKKEIMEYSYFWGLFKSKDYPKGKSVVFKVEKPEFSTSLSESTTDTTKYEQKSILWGAIQWTEKKRTIHL